jgi:phosphorylase kinase alpha/beta subunit
MSNICHEIPPDQWLAERPSVAEIDAIQQFLNEQGTFTFPTLSSGLFSAAAAENPEFRLTGYQYVWARDNCHIAHALWASGQKQAAARAVRSLLTFYQKHEAKFREIIRDPGLASDPMLRPHVRFDGETLEEVQVRWSHAQNDALGYVLWLCSKLLRAGDLETSLFDASLLHLFVQYFQAISYWNDEDSGHWEETRKIEASSIGTVMAGLMELRAWLADHPQPEFDLVLLNDLIEQGRQTLAEILPAECIQPADTQNRRYDAALLFLIYPLGVLGDGIASQIIQDVAENLAGPIGIRRYNGDSYWCANYRDLLSAETRTADFSDDMAARDRLLQPGQEAQWCLFDPILSVIHGQRYQQNGSEGDLKLQVHHLRRSLRQLTTTDSRFPAYRCPESYFMEHGHWIPNDICPLLWTQANLLLALQAMRNSAAR